MILQITLAPMATFCALRSFRFKPPSWNGLETVSQFISESLFSFCFPPFHKSVLIKSSILFMIPAGAKRTEKLKRGKLLRMGFMGIAFPAKFSQEDPQAYNFCLNLSNRGSQSLPNALE